MKQISINNFSGGIADPRETSTTMCTSVRNFNVQKTKLTPYRDTVTETLSSGTLTNHKLTDVIRYNYTGTTTDIFALGNQSSVNTYPKIWQKATPNTITASFQDSSNGEGTDGVVVPGSLIGYKGSIYCFKTKSGSTYLMKYVYGTSFTEIGAIGTSPSNGVVPQPFIHPKDNKIYFASGNEVKSYDGSSLSSVVTFSAQHNINSLTWQGNNVVLGMVAKDMSGSVLGIWSGSTTSAELIDVVEFGSDTLMVLDNLNDVVVGVSALSEGGASDSGVRNFVTIRGYAGGSSSILKKIESVGTLGSRVYPFKVHKDSKIFFPMSAYLNGTRVHQIWSIYKNENGLWTVTPDRKVSNDTELTSLTITGFSMIGDYFWVGFSDGQFRRTDNNNYYTSTSIYETLINPSMEIGDRTKMKELKSVSVSKAHNSGNVGQLIIKYSINGGQNWVTVGTLASAGINTLKATNESTGKPFNSAYEYMFRVESTLGAEITEFKYAYEVKPELI